MKYEELLVFDLPPTVAPFTGAWIEIGISDYHREENNVAPFTGAWIEIGKALYFSQDIASLPSRERGLKFT